MKFHWSVITKIAACSLLISGGLAHAQDPQLVPVLQGLLQKYQRCILEEYENQVDENDGNKTNPRALGPKRDAATCVAGNVCTRASRQDMYNRLKAQADRGDPTNFEANLEQAILNDCSWCAKHNEFHTKLMHCTLECNGNQNWQANPFKFDAKVGPCFEVCKAGVDIEKAVNDVKNDIQHFLHGAIETFLPAVNLQGYELTQATSQATGGPSILTNRIIVDPGPAEECQSRVSPLGYVVPPADLLDWSATEALPFRKDETNYVPLPPPTRDRYEPQALGNPEIQLAIGANEGRLRPDLRQAAAQANPVGSLCLAAAAYALGNKLDANAFADLSVTGRRTFEAFRQRLPKDADILACLRKNPRTQALPADKLQDATKTVLNRAYRVLGVLRTGGWPGTKDDPACSSDRGPLGYIAVSGEDDQPHRPVNVPSAEFPQYDLDVPVPRPVYPPYVPLPQKPLNVRTRFMIAHAHPPQGAERASCVSAAGTVPADRTPVLASDAEVFLFINGMDGRLEEAMDLTHELHKLGKKRGKNYTVIAMDLPTAGYADNIDPNKIAPLTASGRAGGGVDGLGFAANNGYVVPIVDFTENFVVSFVNTLNKYVPVATHIKAVIGGSLGGNMAFRLGRPRPDAPWVNTVVPWSPAAIWPSLADDPLSRVGLAVPWYLAGGEPSFAVESPGARRSFFFGGFDWNNMVLGKFPIAGGAPQAYYWSREGWPCKKLGVRLARIDRYETYDHNFRLWHWRLAMEQMLFSQRNPTPGSNPAHPQPLYLSNTKRMLLLCGMDDIGGNLCEDTREVAANMKMTPGRGMFLKTTGHSLDSERPRFLAEQIVNFLDGH